MNEEIKSKKSIWKRWWFWFIIVTTIISIIAGIGGSRGDKKENQEQQLSQEQKQSQVKNIELSEGEQKGIFFEIVQAEDKATKEAEEKYPTFYTDNLQVGQEYQLSKETPLMPELEPADPIATIQAIKQVSAGKTIRIVKRVMKNNEKIPWYYVEVKGIGYGWINSVALRGQFKKAEQEQINNQIDYERTLTEKYKGEVAKKYNLTDEQLTKISVEGVTKHWPMPKL